MASDMIYPNVGGMQSHIYFRSMQMMGRGHKNVAVGEPSMGRTPRRLLEGEDELAGLVNVDAKSRRVVVSDGDVKELIQDEITLQTEGLARSRFLKMLRRIKTITVTDVPTVLRGTPEKGVEMETPMEVTYWLAPRNERAAAPASVVAAASEASPEGVSKANEFTLYFDSNPCGVVDVSPLVAAMLPDPTAAPDASAKVTCRLPVRLCPRPEDSASDEATRKLISNFVNGVDAEVELREELSESDDVATTNSLSGDSDATPLPSVTTVRFKMVASKVKLLVNATSSFPMRGLEMKIRTKAAITVLNPFGVNVEVRKIDTKIEYDGYSIGRLVEDAAPFKMPAHGEVRSPVYLFTLDLEWGAVQSIVWKYRGALKVDVVTVIDCSIGTYETTIEYQQTEIPASLAWNVS
ncbi:hypothetical protein HK101_003027 [Irineochytrium annulatum]|nr:hypothetical protein HK101_003027 [Irineochytrium annulatum]